MAKFDSIHDNYKKYKNEEKDIKKIYETVKKDYIEDTKLDVTLEKIYLEKKIEKYSGETINFFMTIFISAMVSVFTLTMERAIAESTSFGFSIIVITVFIIGVLYFSLKKEKKNIQGEINEYTYYKICLKVLEDIEKRRG